MPTCLKRICGHHDLHFVTFHVLIGEHEIGTPSTVLQVLKPRFYDFNVYTRKKMIEKLRYMHRNPVKRGLVPSPELWAWSSFRAYYFGEKSVVWIEGLNPNPKLRVVKPNRVKGD